MAPTASEPGILGSHPPDFSLPGVDGKTYGLSDFQGAQALVVVFLCNHCPYVIATQGRFNRLARESIQRGARWVGISSNDASNYPEDSFEAMKVRAREQDLSFPYLYDETQKVARAFGAVCTPEFYLYGKASSGQATVQTTPGSQFVLRYKGRLDDHWKDEQKVTQTDLADALELVLAGKLPNSDQKPALGCSIKWKSSGAI
jgi:peroxiredoxin